MKSQKQKIETEKAPKAIGPYSQAIMVPAGQMIFVSGQLPLDLNTSELISGDIKTLTNRVLDNIEAILKTKGASFEHIVRVDIFLTDLKNFAAVNEEYAKRFVSTIPPARQTIEVSKLPKNSPVEISAIAVI